MNENMIFNLGGSGGAALNFKVVNNPKPENPKENTIWVDTDTEITGWQFASDDPNLLDFNNWANSISVQNGSKVVSGSSISLTASADDCYTNFGSGGVQIPCVAGRTYILEWEHSGANGEVYCFPSGGADNLVMEGASAGKLEYTPTAGVTFFTFRIGVRTANTTATYSNIRITEKERAFKPGTVWIQTGTTSPVAMDVLKKNGIMVYPLSAKQYVGGAWVDKEAKSYQDGQWVAWVTYLYNKGDECTSITGGWGMVAEGTNCSVVKNATSITLNANAGNGIMAVPENKVNLTNIKTLAINITDAVANNAVISVSLRVMSTKSTSATPVSQLTMSKNATAGELASDLVGRYTLNVSDLNDSYYVGLFVYGGNGISLTFNSTTLE